MKLDHRQYLAIVHIFSACTFCMQWIVADSHPDKSIGKSDYSGFTPWIFQVPDWYNMGDTGKLRVRTANPNMKLKTWKQHWLRYFNEMNKNKKA